MQDGQSRLFMLLCIIAAVAAAFFIFREYSRAGKAYDESIIAATSSPKDSLAVALKKRKEKPPRRSVKGLYLTAHSPRPPPKI